ncbi:MAG TPA: monovalent cation/H+ antiporter complex subunit F [Candidatus Hydrogenedentes bacterium]|nr:monovalent cation/H+ antiporter complex subunit F [Candidatus Hydrogenedentota bacterium]
MSPVMHIAAALLGGALLLAVGRLLRGPTLPDRVVALDLISTLVVGIICMCALVFDQPVYLRDALVLTKLHGLSTAEAWIGLISLTLLYAVLMVIEIGLLAKYIKLGVDPFEEPPNVPVGGADDDAPMTFAY